MPTNTFVRRGALSLSAFLLFSPPGLCQGRLLVPGGAAVGVSVATSVVTVVGMQFGFLLGGSVVTEAVFAFNGIGQLLVTSVSFRDYPCIQSLILIFSLHFVVINFVVDILYAVLNPEIQLN